MNAFIARTKYWKTILVAALVIGCFAVYSIDVSADDMNPAAQSSPQDREIRSLRDLNKALIDIAALVKPSVVTVSTEQVIKMQQTPFASPFLNDPFFNRFFGFPGQGQQPREQEFHQEGLGSGVIVSDDGYILTNNHVVDKADSIFVQTVNGDRYTAKVIGVDPHTDIAVLKIDADNLKSIRIGDSENLHVGEMVMAIGSPMSENLASTVTQGIVSAKGRSNVGLADYEDYIQTDAAINPGNSGGALVNLDGELVGINSAIVSRSGGFMGIGFAVPVNMAMNVMNSLISTGKVVRGWLGVSIQNVDQALGKAMNLDTHEGALVGDVLPDGPAANSGIEAGDVIVAVDRHPIKDMSQLRNRIASTPPGTKVELTVLRSGKAIDYTVKLGELPDNLASLSGTGVTNDLLGFSVSTLNDDLAGRYNIDGHMTGVVVTSIDMSSTAYRAGLREGDLIVSVNREKVANAGQFNSKVSGLNHGDTILLRVYSDGQARFVAYAL